MPSKPPLCCSHWFILLPSTDINWAPAMWEHHGQIWTPRIDIGSALWNSSYNGDKCKQIFIPTQLSHSQAVKAKYKVLSPHRQGLWSHLGSLGKHPWGSDTCTETMRVGVQREESIPAAHAKPWAKEDLLRSRRRQNWRLRQDPRQARLHTESNKESLKEFSLESKRWNVHF